MQCNCVVKIINIMKPDKFSFLVTTTEVAHSSICKFHLSILFYFNFFFNRGKYVICFIIRVK